MKNTEFVPYPLFKNCHVMTIVPAVWPRPVFHLLKQSSPRTFDVHHHSKVLAHLHITEPGRPTLLVVHGLEGSSSATYVLGLTNKALAAGMNVVRMNLRNCGGTLELTPTLYNAGLSGDVITIVRELKEIDKVGPLFIAGYSLGGNIVLKAAAELGADGRDLLAGVCAVSPSLDLAACVEAISKGFNRFYEQRFLVGLKQKIMLKDKLFPKRFDLDKLKAIETMREFDDTFTAPDGGYGTAENYYKTASAINMLDRISIPTLIVTAKDDPIVPFDSFLSPKLQNPHIMLLTPEHGGHGGFVQSELEEKRGPGTFDRFWAENRIISYCQNLLASGF